MQINEPDESFSTEEEKKILDAAQDVARTEFDFPPRIGCPDSTTLRCLARRDPSVPDSPDLVDHIGTCSPCFIEYSRYRDEYKHRPRQMYALACAAVVIVVLITGTALLRAPEQSKTPPIETAGSQAPSNGTVAAPTQPIAMTLNLTAFSPTRSDTAQPPKLIQLPAKSVKLTLRLPLSMEPGSYRVLTRLASKNVRVRIALNCLLYPLGEQRSRPRPVWRSSLLDDHIKTKLKPIGLGWVSFRVMRSTHASLSHQAKVDPKVAADQRGHGIGVALDVCTKSSIQDRAAAAKRLERAVLKKVVPIRKKSA
jgi:hypothetical protein